METVNIKQIRIVIAVALQDAGEVTRALELARGIRDHQPDGWNAEIIFLSHGSRFLGKVTDAGFSVYPCQPQFAGISYQKDVHSQGPEFIGSATLAYDLIRGEIAALSELQPDLVLYGFWPSAGIARQMLGIAGVCFLPLPFLPLFSLDQTTPAFLQDIPDAAKPLTYLPLSMRREIIKHIPARIIRALPYFVQRNFRLGAEACGWKEAPLRHIWDMLRADLTIINDLPEFYTGISLPENVRLVGPLFAPSESNAELDPIIARLFAPSETRPKIFCTMGSSGTRKHFLEAVTALTRGKAAEWNSVILASPAVCSLADAVKLARNHQNMYITDAFVPALQVNALADIVVCHGGQGTVQTAMTSGTPIVAVAMQMEQQVNLDHIVTAGAGIRLPSTRWTASNIQRAADNIIACSHYQERARHLQEQFQHIDGKKNASHEIWQWITQEAGTTAHKQCHRSNAFHN